MNITTSPPTENPDTPRIHLLMRKLLICPEEDLQQIEVILKATPCCRHYCTTKEVMGLLGISRATLFRKIANGTLKPLPVDGRDNVFIAKEVYALMADQDPCGLGQQEVPS
jgi:predicted DNA-binding transcriptional regulator AlpA